MAIARSFLNIEGLIAATAHIARLILIPTAIEDDCRLDRIHLLLTPIHWLLCAVMHLFECCIGLFAGLL
jgi:hypothetical protein